MESPAQTIERKAEELIALIESLQPAPVDMGDGMALNTVVPQFHHARDKIREAVFWAKDGIADVEREAKAA